MVILAVLLLPVFICLASICDQVQCPGERTFVSRVYLGSGPWTRSYPGNYFIIFGVYSFSPRTNWSGAGNAAACSTRGGWGKHTLPGALPQFSNFSYKQTVVGITHGNCFLLNKHTKAKTYLIYSHIPQNDNFILLNSFPPFSDPATHAQTWEKMEQRFIFPYQWRNYYTVLIVEKFWDKSAC